VTYDLTDNLITGPSIIISNIIISSNITSALIITPALITDPDKLELKIKDPQIKLGE
jgi:hypothetical protein